MPTMSYRNRRPSFFESLESRQLLSGTVIPSIVPVTISSAAKAADPTLNNYACYDVVVTVSSGSIKWTSQDVRVDVISGGTFYTHTASGKTKLAQPALWPSQPNLAFDTFVAGPDFGSPIILGSYKPGSSTPQFTDTVMNVTFGNLPSPGTGTYTAARITIPKGAIATIDTQSGNGDQPTQPVRITSNLPA